MKLRILERDCAKAHTTGDMVAWFKNKNIYVRNGH